jgi:hypothetical protein
MNELTLEFLAKRIDALEQQVAGIQARIIGVAPGKAEPRQEGERHEPDDGDPVPHVIDEKP